MSLMLAISAALAAQTGTASELEDVASTQKLALAALVECVRDKSKELDDGQESVKTIVEASFTACKDVRDKAVFLTTWMRRLEKHESVKDATDFALTFQQIFDKKLTDDAVLALLENRATKHAPNK